MIEIKKEFQEAVSSYIEEARKNFFSRQGEESDMRPYEEKIANSFSEVPAEKREAYLYFVLKTMSKVTGGRRLTESCRDLALAFVEELEQIE